MKLLTNPIVLRMALVFFAAAFAFVLGLLAMRHMRRSIAKETSFAAEAPASGALPLHTYHAVIQQLKQQKHELQSLQQVERRRAKTSENVSAAVLSHLSCGVMFLGPNGLVRQANAAARQILGFASPAGMSVAEIFRHAVLIGATQGSSSDLAKAIEASVREKTPGRQLEAEYLTPSGDERVLDITVSSVHAPDGEVLGAACVINDLTPMAHLRQQEQLRGEVSAEMALQLRNSLATITGYAHQLAASREPELARRLAADIAAEAEHLDRTIGGFLAGTKTAQAAEA